MVADADGEPLPGCREQRKRTFMRREKLAGVFEESAAMRRKFHVAGRALEQPETEPVFQALELQADGSLRRLHGFGRTRETA
ncbi:hypothetical protein D3C71_1667010 [compost metagenome]